MKIGISSQNFRTITGHAGKARRFFVYEGSDKNNIACVDKIDLPKSESIHESNPADKHPIDDFDVLITASCGEGFQRKMAARGIKLIKTDEENPLVAAQLAVEGELPSHQ